jgi:hypothetical protein
MHGESGMTHSRIRTWRATQSAMTSATISRTAVTRCSAQACRTTCLIQRRPRAWKRKTASGCERSEQVDAKKQTADGFDYLDPAQFREYFGADLPAEQATFEARSQVLTADANFRAIISKPVWRTSRAGRSSRRGTERSILTSSDGTRSEPTVIKSKLPEPATRSMSAGRKRSRR